MEVPFGPHHQLKGAPQEIRERFPGGQSENHKFTHELQRDSSLLGPSSLYLPPESDKDEGKKNISWHCHFRPFHSHSPLPRVSEGSPGWSQISRWIFSGKIEYPWLWSWWWYFVTNIVPLHGTFFFSGSSNVFLSGELFKLQSFLFIYLFFLSICTSIKVSGPQRETQSSLGNRKEWIYS